MIEMLEDKIQFREFGEFCIKESCVENIVNFDNKYIYFIFYFLLYFIFAFNIKNMN